MYNGTFWGPQLHTRCRRLSAKERHVFSRQAVFNARYVKKPETLLHFLVDCDRISKNLMFFFPFLESLVLPAVYKIEKFTNRMDGNPRELLRDIRWS